MYYVSIHWFSICLFFVYTYYFIVPPTFGACARDVLVVHLLGYDSIIYFVLMIYIFFFLDSILYRHYNILILEQYDRTFLLIMDI